METGLDIGLRRASRQRPPTELRNTGRSPRGISFNMRLPTIKQGDATFPKYFSNVSGIVQDGRETERGKVTDLRL